MAAVCEALHGPAPAAHAAELRTTFQAAIRSPCRSLHRILRCAVDSIASATPVASSPTAPMRAA